DEAVDKYSDDESKNNNGLLLNTNNMSTLHVIDEMSPTLKFEVVNLKEEMFSSPVLTQMPDETKAYRLLKLNKRIEEHKANLVDDFSMIKDFAINIKKQEEVMKWIAKTISNTYIKINDDISACEFKNKWVK
ncbi:hypothetical protein N9I30_02270, partial [Flavobacteriales bacterium]|nr:hypothetical protein [Flavobacteriales bacterium]